MGVSIPSAAGLCAAILLALCCTGSAAAEKQKTPPPPPSLSSRDAQTVQQTMAQPVNAHEQQVISAAESAYASGMRN